MSTPNTDPNPSADRGGATGQEGAPPVSIAEHFANAPLSSHGSRWNACWERNQTGWDRGTHSQALLEVLTQGLPSQNVDYLHPSLSSSSSSSASTNPASATGDSISNDNKGTKDSKTVSAAELFPGHPQQQQQQQRQHRKKALVPGCGRGYDVLLLSSLGYDVIGLDLSPIGVQRAKEHAEQSQRDGSYPVTVTTNPGGGGGEAPGTFQFVEGDFFENDWLHSLSSSSSSSSSTEEDSGSFDLIYDYTFGCALPPSARAQWASRHASLLRKESGRLVCLEFPSTKAPSEPGPPWAMPPDVYVEFLGDGGAGLKRLVHGRPTMSHTSGVREEEDGKGGKRTVVVDCVSVWSH